MAFAPNSVYDDGSIIGRFNEKVYDHLFEFSDNADMGEFSMYGYPHKIWVTSPWKMDHGFRYGLVKKTVAYVVVDEDEFGNPVVEKWKIKDLRIYDNKSL